MMVKTKTALLRDVVNDIWNGDLLLFRRRSIISIYGRGEYSHAAMAGWWSGYLQGRDNAQLMALESREFIGSRAVLLENYIEKCPAGIDVYRPQLPDGEGHRRELAFAEARRKLGRPYSYAGVLLAGASHVPGLRFVRKFETDDDARNPFYGDGEAQLQEPDPREHCSQFYNSAWRHGAGIDWVPNVPDHLTEPSDLGRCYGMEYMFTLGASR